MLYNSDNTTNSNGSFEQRYKTLLTAFDTIEPSFVMARVGTILEANKAFAARFSMQVEECIGKNAYDFISPLCRLQIAEKRLMKLYVLAKPSYLMMYKTEGVSELCFRP